MKQFNSIRAFNNWMKKVTQNLQNAEDPIKESLEGYLTKKTAERFRKEKGPKGKWKPLKRSTQNIRRNLGYGPSHPILKRTGKLVKSVTSSANVRVSNNKGVLGSDVEYAKYQQEGTSLISARPFLYTKKSDLDNFGKIFANWVKDVMQKTTGISITPSKQSIPNFNVQTSYPNKTRP